MNRASVGTYSSVVIFTSRVGASAIVDKAGRSCTFVCWTRSASPLEVVHIRRCARAGSVPYPALCTDVHVHLVKDRAILSNKGKSATRHDAMLFASENKHWLIQMKNKEGDSSTTPTENDVEKVATFAFDYNLLTSLRSADKDPRDLNREGECRSLFRHGFESLLDQIRVGILVPTAVRHRIPFVEPCDTVMGTEAASGEGRNCQRTQLDKGCIHIGGCARCIRTFRQMLRTAWGLSVVQLGLQQTCQPCGEELNSCDPNLHSCPSSHPRDVLTTLL